MILARTHTNVHHSSLRQLYRPLRLGAFQSSHKLAADRCDVPVAHSSIQPGSEPDSIAAPRFVLCHVRNASDLERLHFQLPAQGSRP